MYSSPTCLLTLRSISCCSMPHSSGNSDKIPRPPSAATISACARSMDSPKSRKSIRPAVFQTHNQFRQRRRFRSLLSASDHADKRVVNRLREHLRLFADLSLIKNEQRLRESRFALLDFFDERHDLRFLATETQNGLARHIRMVMYPQEIRTNCPESSLVVPHPCSCVKNFMPSIFLKTFCAVANPATSRRHSN